MGVPSVAVRHIARRRRRPRGGQPYNPLTAFDWKAAFLAGDPLFVEPDVAYTDASAGLVLPGVSGNYASVPDEAALDITGDIDIRVKVALDDWSALQILADKWNGAGTSGYQFRVHDASGSLLLGWGNGASNTATSTVGNGITDGETSWVRVTLDVDNGAGGYDVKFYKSTDGVSWTQIGSTVTGGATTSISANAEQMGLGATRTGGTPCAGDFYQAQVYNGIDGTKVLDVDFQRARTASFTASTGQTVTVHSGAPVSAWRNGGTTRTEGAYLSTVGLVLPGTSGNYASVPDEAALDITGDIDIRVKVALDDWTPASTATLIAKDNVTSRAWYLVVNTGGTLSLFWFPTGTSTGFQQAASTVATGVSDGQTKWVRATLDVDNGASGNDVKFYLSDDGESWSQLGSTVTGGATTNLFAVAADVTVGIRGDGANIAAGNVYKAQVYDGIAGTKVLDVDFQRADTNKFTCTTGQTVTVHNTLDASQATGSKQPAYRASVAALNNRPAVQGDGIDDFLATAAWSSALSQPRSRVVIGSLSAASKVLGDGIAVGARSLIGRNGTTAWEANSGTSLTGGTADTDPHLFVVVSNGVSSTLYVDGASAASGDAGAHTATGTTIAANYNGSSGFNNGHTAFDGQIAGDITADANWPAFVAWVESEYGLVIA